MNAHIAVVGCGYWGRNLVRNFAQLNALRTICDAHPGALRSQAALYPGVTSTSSFGDVLADPAVDAVVLATPAALHYEQAKSALLHDKHVFVEKPLALHFREGQELVELAEARGLVLMVGHILEYHPGVVMLNEIVRRGDLGKLWYVYSNRLNLGKVRQEENILWSFAPHDISVISTIVGAEPTLVSSMGSNYLQQGIADVTVTNLVFPEGVRGHVFVSWLHPSKEQKLVVVGDKRMAVFDDTAKDGKLKVYDKGIDWQGGLPVARQTSETVLFFDQTEPLRLECQHFLDCVHDGAQPLTDGANGLRVLRVLEASQMSVDRGGMPVSLSEVPALESVSA
jgi:UDP-2-acetamido-3-amino-2,3-dideoxy-glucuronate N-acetyltransferase